MLPALLLPAGVGASPGSYQVSPRCDGRSGCYSSIAAALKQAVTVPAGQWVNIRIAAGDYREKVTIGRSRTRLIGAGAARSRLRHDAVAKTSRAFHRDGWGTPGSATLTINADEVIVRDLTVENGFNYLANDALRRDDPNRIAEAQAVALLLDIDSDRVLLDRVALKGYQDTLFANGHRALVRDSLITGNIDFIFGNGMLWIERGELRSRPRSAPMVKDEIQSYIAAPSTPAGQYLGIVVQGARLTREADVLPNSVALARPWHPTTRFPDGRYADPDAIGQALFIDCWMDAHISDRHWTSMAGTARDGSKSIIFEPQQARFFEAGSRGPGARHVDIGMNWRPDRDIDGLRVRFLNGWKPGS
ncbi:pectinesterase family protein [Sphingobium sufflavum]|uniref:pectinesterase family protein n=1 Tax=Sphingobium sufflavum TaxID=1129547 RepID=UPI001F243FAF|nr:pectinesterase family protein [Sphingobium sufflavum]MCE7796748.1 pectinesterase family protein [Sphingobium sufflavum]